MSCSANIVGNFKLQPANDITLRIHSLTRISRSHNTINMVVGGASSVGMHPII